MGAAGATELPGTSCPQRPPQLQEPALCVGTVVTVSDVYLGQVTSEIPQSSNPQPPTTVSKPLRMRIRVLPRSLLCTGILSEFPQEGSLLPSARITEIIPFLASEQVPERAPEMMGSSLQARPKAVRLPGLSYCLPPRQHWVSACSLRGLSLSCGLSGCCGLHVPPCHWGTLLESACPVS